VRACVSVCIGLGVTLRARGTTLGSQLALPFVDTGFALDVFAPVLQRVEAGGEVYADDAGNVWPVKFPVGGGSIAIVGANFGAAPSAVQVS